MMKRGESLQKQVDRLVSFIQQHYPERTKEGGAIDTAIQILEGKKATELNQKEHRYMEKQMEKLYDIVHAFGETPVLYRIPQSWYRTLIGDWSSPGGITVYPPMAHEFNRIKVINHKHIKLPMLETESGSIFTENGRLL